jgi:hypothetical protein
MPTQEEVMSPEELATNHLEELMAFLSEEAELSPEDIMVEVIALVDNYKSELILLASEEEKDEILHLAAEDNSEEVEEQDERLVAAFQKLSSTNFNRGFLLGKATDTYYKKLGLDADSFSELPPADKVKHRKEITKIFNGLVIKEAQKPPKAHKISEYGGAIKRTRKDEDIVDIDDGKTDAEVSYYKSQIKELKKAIRLTKAQIEQAERQNKIENVSSVIISQNLDRVDELKNELAEHEKELKYYQAKL